MRIHSFGMALLSLPFAASVASAHIAMTSPARRYADQKVGPCGKLNGLRTANVTTFAPGETITVTWDETINHPGHYRISFDADGHDDFVDPASYTELNSNAAVLVDGIADKQGGSYTAQVTLPNVTCNNCTLQLIQMMTDKAPYAPGTDDIYYQCADLILGDGAPAADAGPGAPDAAPAGTPDAGPGGGGGDDPEGGCSIAAGGGSGGGARGALALLLVVVGAMIAARRRRA